MMRAVAIAATCAALSVVAGGCGDEEPTGGTPGDATEAPYGTTGENRTSGDRAATRVEMSDNRFAPAALNVEIGDTVTFANVGQLPHTATAVEGAEFDSRGLEPGESYEWKATSAGEVQYVCEFHAGMKGTLTVE